MARRIGFGGDAEPPKAPLWTRLPAILFLLLWLSGWSAGILVAVLAIKNGIVIDFSLVIGLSIAVTIWGMGVRTLVGLLRGKSLSVFAWRDQQ